MERITVTIEWEGYPGPYGSQDVQKILEANYKNHFKVHRVNLVENKPEKLVYSVPEAAKLLGVSTGNLYRLVDQKQIPGVRIGKRWLISKVALEKHLGAPIGQKEQSILNSIDRADLLATTDEALKLYDLLRGKLKTLATVLSKDEKNNL